MVDLHRLGQHRFSELQLSEPAAVALGPVSPSTVDVAVPDQTVLQHGLVRGSFIPPRPIRELRDLTRGPRRLVGERSSVVNRVHKVLEDANIKLSSVATDVMGKSGWNMVGAIIDGEQDPHKLAAFARGRLKIKREQLEQALHGRVTYHHRCCSRSTARTSSSLTG